MKMEKQGLIEKVDSQQDWLSNILRDLKGAYQQNELDEESRHLTNFTTEYGTYRYTRLINASGVYFRNA